MAFYVGARHQRGFGLGGVFGSLLRAAVPTLKTVGKKALRSGLEAGVGIASDALQGKNIKAAAKQRVTQAAAKAIARGIKGPSTTRQPQKRKRQPKKGPAKQSKRRRTPKDIFD